MSRILLPQLRSFLLISALATLACGDAPEPSGPGAGAVAPQGSVAGTGDEDVVMVQGHPMTRSAVEEAVERLLEPLNNPESDPQVRVFVASQLGTFPGPQATLVLASALDAEDEAVRHAVIDALATRSDEAVKAVLQRASEHRDPYVVSQARAALDR